MTDAPKHPTEPDPANELASDNSLIDPRDFRNALGTYATGVTIITAAGADGKPYGLTCNSFTSLSLNPPLALRSLATFSPALTRALGHTRRGWPGRTAEKGSVPRRPNFSRNKDLAAERVIWRAGSVSPSRCCTATFQARMI